MISSIGQVKVDVGSLDNVKYIAKQKIEESLYSSVKKELGGQVVTQKAKPVSTPTLADLVAIGQMNNALRERMGGGKIGGYGAMDRRVSDLMGIYQAMVAQSARFGIDRAV